METPTRHYRIYDAGVAAVALELGLGELRRPDGWDHAVRFFHKEEIHQARAEHARRQVAAAAARLKAKTKWREAYAQRVEAGSVERKPKKAIAKTVEPEAIRYARELIGECHLSGRTPQRCWEVAREANGLDPTAPFPFTSTEVAALYRPAEARLAAIDEQTSRRLE